MPLAVNGIELLRETRGDDPPLRLLGGLAADSAFWPAVIERLAPHLRVTLVDTRGCGRTTPMDVRRSSDIVRQAR